jgi:acetolactate synthase-1/2/3 large subunit
MTGWDFETCVRFNLPFLGVVGNNSAMNQIRCGQIMKYGAERGEVGNRLGDVPYDRFAQILGGHGEEVREPSQIRPALERAREAVASGVPALVNIWVDIDVWAPGTRNQTMYK